jgi:hypothetical protein
MCTLFLKFVEECIYIYIVASVRVYKACYSTLAKNLLYSEYDVLQQVRSDRCGAW